MRRQCFPLALALVLTAPTSHAADPVPRHAASDYPAAVPLSVKPVDRAPPLFDALVKERINSQWAEMPTSAKAGDVRPTQSSIVAMHSGPGDEPIRSTNETEKVPVSPLPVTPAAAATPALLTLTPGNARLSSTLAEFARLHGWSIAWEIDRDFPIDYPARFEGAFLDIIANVVLALRTTDAPIRAKVYHGNKVIRIVNATR